MPDYKFGDTLQAAAALTGADAREYQKTIKAMEKLKFQGVLADEATLAGFEGRLSEDMPSKYPDEDDNWFIWSSNWNSGRKDALEDANAFLADAQGPDATGQDDFRQDHIVNESL